MSQSQSHSQSQSVSVRFHRLLKKCVDVDKDERYMAMSDISNDLESLDGQLELNLQSAICKAILTGLDDSSTDVQTVTVKCFSSLVKRISCDQLADIGEKLTILIVQPDKHESRDIYSIGLKTVVSAVSDGSGMESLGVRILSGLINGIKRDESQRAKFSGSAEQLIQLECSALEVIRDVLLRFGNHLASLHESALELLTRLLIISDSAESREPVRKRVIQCLGALVVNLQEKQFNSLMEFVISELERSSRSSSRLFIFIQTIGVISQTAGMRMGKFIQRIMPKLELFCDSNGATDGSMEDRDQLIELWENCLQAFESLIGKCNEMTPFVGKIIAIALEFLTFDPNYSYDEDGKTMETNDSTGQGQAFDDWGDPIENDDFNDFNDSDEDENSWKVRRAAVRCLTTMIKTRPELLEEFIPSLFSSLLSRFKERDQNVKLSIMRCVAELLKESSGYRNGQFAQKSRNSENKSKQRIIPASVRIQIPSIVSGAMKLLSDRTAKSETKIGVFQLWNDLIMVLSGGLEEFLSSIIPAAIDAIHGANSDDTKLKLESTIFLRVVLEFHSTESLKPYLHELTAIAIAGVRDSLSLKLKSESLRLISLIVQRLPQADSSAPLAVALYDAIFTQLSLLDVDQEVKEASLLSVSLLLSRHSNPLAQRFPDCLSLIVQRLNNELTRIFALRAIARISPSIPNSIFPRVSAIFAPAFAEYFLPFLRKENQILRHETVKTMISIIRTSAPMTEFPPALFQAVHRELLPHLNDSDLILAHLSIDLLISILAVHNLIPESESQALLARLIAFVRSPLLHGSALNSLVKLFCSFLTVKDNPILRYSNLFAELLSSVENQKSANENSSNNAAAAPSRSSDSTNSSISSSIAHVISSLAHASGSAEVSSIINRFISILQNSSQSAGLSQLALLVVGALGRQIDLTSFGPVEEIILNCFHSTHESIRLAAANCLGNLSVGNRNFYLPKIIEATQSNQNNISLLLISIRESILRHTYDSSLIQLFSPHVNSLIPILLASTNSTDDLTRSNAAECLSLLSIVEPNSIFPHLIALSQSPQPSTRSSFISALRFAFGPNSNLELLKKNLPTFLNILNDADISVHRESLMALNSIANSHIELIDALLNSLILPVLYSDIQPNPSLVRLVDLGPFKHRVDDGLPIRKAAYLCLETIFSADPDRFDVAQFMNRIRPFGFVDHNDIQILCYDLLYKMASQIGDRMLAAVEELPVEMMKGIKEQLKEAKGEANPERAKDVLRAAVRSIERISRIPGIENCPQFVEFYQRVLKTAILIKMLNDLATTK